MKHRQDKCSLRSGYTTGACAVAATQAATIALLKQEMVEWVQVDLPGDKRASFNINRCVFVGHGQGLHTHEPPYLVPTGKDADIVLEEGMYLAVEVSAFDAPEFRVIGGFPEDDILVTKDGFENLTKDIPNHLWIA